MTQDEKPASMRDNKQTTPVNKDEQVSPEMEKPIEESLSGKTMDDLMSHIPKELLGSQIIYTQGSELPITVYSGMLDANEIECKIHVNANDSPKQQRSSQPLLAKELAADFLSRYTDLTFEAYIAEPNSKECLSAISAHFKKIEIKNSFNWMQGSHHPTVTFHIFESLTDPKDSPEDMNMDIAETLKIWTQEYLLKVSGAGSLEIPMVYEINDEALIKVIFWSEKPGLYKTITFILPIGSLENPQGVGGK